MADFGEIAIAAEPAFGVPEGTVENALMNQRSDDHAQVLDIPLASILCEFMRLHSANGWEGTTSELYAELKRRADPNAKALPKPWPGSPAALSKELERLAPALRKADSIDFRRGRGTAKRKIMLSMLPGSQVCASVPSSSSLPSEPTCDQDKSDDGINDETSVSPATVPSLKYPLYDKRNDGSDGNDGTFADTTFSGDDSPEPSIARDNQRRDFEHNAFADYNEREASIPFVGEVMEATL